MKTSKNDCKHPGIYFRDVQGMSGPYIVGYCRSCNTMLARTTTTTSAHAQALRDLAERDGREADRKGVEPCPHGLHYVFDEKAGTCALCATWSVERLLASVSLARLQ